MAGELMHRARAFWAGRNTRERRMLGLGGAVLLLGLLYGLVYDPLAQARQKMLGRLPELRAELRLMRAQVAQIEYQRRRAGMNQITAAGLSRLVASTAAGHGLQQAIRASVPLDGERLQVVTQPHPASALLAWLADLERQGARVQSCRISVTGPSGLATLDAIIGVGAP